MYTKKILTTTSNNTTTMNPINDLSLFLKEWFYILEMIIVYSVSVTSTWIWINMQWWTAVVSDFWFIMETSWTATTQSTNNYGTRNQNYTTTSTSRLNNNISIIKSYVHITWEWTIIPHFRSENTGNVTLLKWTHIKCNKI